MADGLTHTFELKIGDGVVLTGSIEFNVDNEASWNTNAALPQMETRQTEAVVSLISALKSLFREFGAIEKVEILEIGE
jgi:hypothetical protein